MITVLKHRLAIVLGHEHPLLVRAHAWRRAVMRTDQRLRREYLRAATEPKLQIGGGWCQKEGWLNTDIMRLPNTMFMDATRRFPFDDGAFQYILCEHMIEHVSYENAGIMLRECHRVMRAFGVIRIITPDLRAMLGLHATTLTARQQAYIDYFCAAHLPGKRCASAANVINGQMRMWGHQFVYDEETLAAAMARAGFRSIARKRLGDGDYGPLRNIENEKRYPPGLLDFESLALEGSK